MCRKLGVRNIWKNGRNNDTIRMGISKRCADTKRKKKNMEAMKRERSSRIFFIIV
jgi:hypothetical protein